MQRNVAPHQACAACKHQRKKCGPKCPLAPYFTQENSQNFQALHKVFGVANVTKLMTSLGTHEQREKAMQSLIWEAECRQRDPVLGCWGQYNELYNKYAALERLVAQHMTYGPKKGLNRWNNTNLGINANNEAMQYIDAGEKLLLEPELRDPMVVCPQNQIGDFNQLYYQGFQDQFNRVHIKSMDDEMLFDGGSQL